MGACNGAGSAAALRDILATCRGVFGPASAAVALHNLSLRRVAAPAARQGSGLGVGGEARVADERGRRHAVPCLAVRAPCSGRQPGEPGAQVVREVRRSGAECQAVHGWRPGAGGRRSAAGPHARGARPALGAIVRTPDYGVSGGGPEWRLAPGRGRPADERGSAAGRAVLADVLGMLRGGLARLDGRQFRLVAGALGESAELATHDILGEACGELGARLGRPADGAGLAEAAAVLHSCWVRVRA